MVGFDEIVVFVGRHIFSVNVVSIEFNCNHDMFVAVSGYDKETACLVCVHCLFEALNAQR